MDAVCVVYVAQYIDIYILFKKLETYVDTMCGNIPLTVTHKACVPH